MTTPNEPPEPGADPSAAVDPLDERLSAALDGVEPEPTVALDAAGRERARALAAARDQLAVPPAPLDDVTRRRVLRAALDASATSSRPSRERTWRRVRPVAVAAAVLAVVGLAGWALSSLDLGSSNSKAGSKAASGETTGARGPVKLGDVSNPQALKRGVEAALRSSNGQSGSVSTTTAPNLNQTTSAPRAPTAATCVASAPVPRGDTAQLLGTATFHDAPAYVVIAGEPARTLVFVLAQADCKLLTSQFLKR